MLEYCNEESRDKLVKIIYKEFENEMKHTCSYVAPKLQEVLDWEQFRYKWLSNNLLPKLDAKIKAWNRKNG
jgi:hypothetical protein